MDALLLWAAARYARRDPRPGLQLHYGLVTLTIAASTFLAGLLADRLPPAIAVWSLVALAATAALGWIAFSRPVWRPRRPRNVD